MNEEKVYVILEKDISSVVSNIYGIYKNKEKAKRLVDQLNSEHIEDDDDVDYVIRSYDLL